MLSRPEPEIDFSRAHQMIEDAFANLQALQAGLAQQADELRRLKDGLSEERSWTEEARSHLVDLQKQVSEERARANDAERHQVVARELAQTLTIQCQSLQQLLAELVRKTKVLFPLET